MTRYAAENFSLRQENRHLRSLESVVKAEEVLAEVAAELEEAFKEAMESESKSRESGKTLSKHIVGVSIFSRSRLLHRSGSLLIEWFS